MVYGSQRNGASIGKDATFPNRQGPKNVSYSIGISPARFPANQEQAKQALTPALMSQLVPD